MNLKNLVPKYETVDRGDILAISIAPEDKYQFYDKEDRVETFKKYTRTHLTLMIKTTCYLRLRTEVSPHGRLHYHGYVIIRDPLRFYLYTIPALEGSYTICIKPLTDEKVWEDYCQKQGIEDDYIQIPYLQKPVRPKANPDSSGEQGCKGSSALHDTPPDSP